MRAGPIVVATWRPARLRWRKQTEDQALQRQAQLAIMQQLEAQLSELIRKHDYRYKDEKRGAEMTSWQRAAGLVSGEEGSIT